MPENFLCQTLDRACFVLLFEIENFLRATIRWELRGRRPVDWLGVLPAELVREAKARAEQEREIAYLDPRRSSILSYLNLSELKDVLLDTAIWDQVFKYYWPPQEVVRAEFRKLLAIRNKSAHFRPVTRRDLRVALRFAEDLADWTRHYRKTRSAIITIDVHSSVAESEAFFEGAAIEGLNETWAGWIADGKAERLRISLATVGNHVAASVAVPEGAVRGENMLGFLEKFESVVTFSRVGDLGERLCVYLSRKVEAAKISECLERFIDCTDDPGPGLSSEETRSQFQFAETEAIIPWNVEMPANFVHPTDEWLIGGVST